MVNILVARRIRFHSILLHVRHHLVGYLGKHLLGEHHLAAVQVVAETSADELAERHELKQQRNTYSYSLQGSSERVRYFAECVLNVRLDQK